MTASKEKKDTTIAQMTASTSNSFVMGDYPYPSNVYVPSFVTVKLSARDNYNVWKTQMLCLIVSHAMLGFIDGQFPSPEDHPQISISGKAKVKDIEAWGRSDALVKGWILGSLSEQALRYVVDDLTAIVQKRTTNKDFNAKDVWDKLQSIYGPAVQNDDPQAETADKKGIEAKETEEIICGPAVQNDDPQAIDLPQETEEAKQIEELKKKLYEATFQGSWSSVQTILENGKVRVTDKITISGNTALHVAVDAPERPWRGYVRKMLALVPKRIGTILLCRPKGTKFLENMLKWVTVEELPYVKNSFGSTLLHVALIVGNNDAAEILVKKSPDLLFVKDNEDNTPLDIALSNKNIGRYVRLLKSPTEDRYVRFLKSTTKDIEEGSGNFNRSRDEFLANVISSKEFSKCVLASNSKCKKLIDHLIDIANFRIYAELARDLLNYSRILHGDTVLMAMAQNFPERNPLERQLDEWTNKYKLSSVFRLYCCWFFCVVPIFFLSWFGGASWFPNWLMILLCITLSLVAASIIAKERTLLLVVVWRKSIKRRALTINDATELLKSVCDSIKCSNKHGGYHEYYTNPILEAARQNAYEVVEAIVSCFPDAIKSENEDGHNIIQSAVINRSEKVYNLVYQMSEQRNTYKTIRDSSGNNLLHLAGRLAPHNKLNLISGAALQLQRELQWFKEIETFVSPLSITQKNSFGETPQMVFTREHKDLVIEGEKWMKAAAESYTITAALITTIVFAAAITVPGGNDQNKGMPIFTNDVVFKLFAASDAISFFTSATSLLMFLSILTARFAEQDFLYTLPTKLIIGLPTLFISTTAMIVTFGATLFLVFGQRKLWILIPIGVLTCLPITFFVTLQYPLIRDLWIATYGGTIFRKKRDRPFY